MPHHDPLPVIQQAYHRRKFPPGFSLVELLVVMILVGALLGLGLGVFGKTAAAARRGALDQLAAAVEQARTAAITRGKPVILAISPPVPGDTGDNFRIGLFETGALPAAGSPITARQIRRWNVLPTGVVFLRGDVDGFSNPLDGEMVDLLGEDGDVSARVHVLAFNPRGGLAWPAGSEPVALHLGSGTIRGDKAISTSDGGRGALRVGRVVARPWRLDG